LLILDLTGVRFLGSAGMAVLINAHDAAQHHDQTGVRVVAAGHAVLRPLEVVGLATTLMIYPTLHAALAGSMTGARQPTSDRSRPTA
jgi:anti-anti-sigma factor